MDKLTTKEYWNKQYPSKLEEPIVIDLKNQLSFLEIDKFLKKTIGPNGNFKFLEIGCAPGGWLHYFYKNFDYNVEGIEYTANGVRLTKNNLKMLKVEAVVHEGDLFENKLNKASYDVVFSAGFIEHFDNPSLAIEKHVELLKKGGYLILEVPNFRGFNGFFQKIANNDLLRIHNLKIMNLNYFKEISERYGLEIVSIAYVGKINFGLFLGKKPLIFIGQVFQFIINKVYFFFKKRIFIKDGPLFSPYIFALYIKK